MLSTIAVAPVSFIDWPQHEIVSVEPVGLVEVDLKSTTAARVDDGR